MRDLVFKETNKQPRVIQVDDSDAFVVDGKLYKARYICKSINGIKLVYLTAGFGMDDMVEINDAIIALNPNPVNK